MTKALVFPIAYICIGKNTMSEESRDESADNEALTEDVIRRIYNYRSPEEVPILKKVTKSVACSSSTVKNAFPFLKWLPTYKLRRDLVGDIIAGFTVAVMHIPHGLAYAPLAGQEPVVGLYMAVFPTLIYVFLGTSRHISLGTFAVLTMMVGKIVSEQSTFVVNYKSEAYNVTNSTQMYSNLEISVTVCFLAGVLQFAMGILHLGALWTLLSNSLISGFTTGAAVHVATYQIKNLIGVSGLLVTGPLKLIYTYIDLAQKIPSTNLVTLGISCCAVFILAFFNEVLKPRIQKKFPKLKVPVPMELLIVLSGIAASYFLKLEEQYQVKIVKSVPTGLPAPVVPVLELIPNVLIDSLVVSIVSISVSMSLASIFAKKGGYEIQQNQELIAYGASNIFGSFFQCAVSGASLSRSLVQYSTGGKTNIAGIFTIIAITFILLFLGPLFEPVPFCVLSSIVVVTLKGLLWQVKDFLPIWKLSKLDGAVWMITFLSVVILDLDIGLGIGIIMSIISLILRGQNPNVVQLGRIPNSNFFMDVSLYGTVEILPNILILKVSGNLNFANFSTVYDKIMEQYREFQFSNILIDEKKSYSLVVNLGCVPSIDPTSISGFADLNKDLQEDNGKLYFSECNTNVYDFMEHCKFFETFPKQNVFVSTFDAIEFLHPSKITLL